MTHKTSSTYAEAVNLPQFRLDPDALRKGLEASETTDPPDHKKILQVPDLYQIDADEIGTLIDDAQNSGALTAPKDWWILIYPTDDEEKYGFVITVWSSRALGESVEVVARSQGFKDACDRDVFEGDDGVARSVQVAEYVAAAANSVAAHVVGAENAQRSLISYVEEGEGDGS